jgi:hypothetical protein
MPTGRRRVRQFKRLQGNSARASPHDYITKKTDNSSRKILAVTGSNILYCLHSPMLDEQARVAMERQVHITCAYGTTNIP